MEGLGTGPMISIIRIREALTYVCCHPDPSRAFFDAFLANDGARLDAKAGFLIIKFNSGREYSLSSLAIRLPVGV